jgi:hypothetical protein
MILGVLPRATGTLYRRTPPPAFGRASIKRVSPILAPRGARGNGHLPHFPLKNGGSRSTLREAHGGRRGLPALTTESMALRATPSSSSLSTSCRLAPVQESSPAGLLARQEAPPPRCAAPPQELCTPPHHGDPEGWQPRTPCRWPRCTFRNWCAVEGSRHPGAAACASSG